MLCTVSSGVLSSFFLIHFMIMTLDVVVGLVSVGLDGNCIGIGISIALSVCIGYR